MEAQNDKLPAWPAFLHGKCPRCRRGRVFANSMYGLRAQKMNTVCEHCHLTFEIEPGYFYAAMFVSYAMNVAEIVTAAVVIGELTGSQNPWFYVIVVLAMSLILSPLNFRYSRMALLYWLTPGLHYDPELSKDKQDL